MRVAMLLSSDYVTLANRLLFGVNYFCRALPHNKCYSTEVVASPKMIPKSGEATSWGEA